MKELDFIKEVLYSEYEVNRVISHLVNSILYYQPKEKIVVLSVLNGGKYLTDRLFSSGSLGGRDRFILKYIHASSYENNKKSFNKEVQIDFLETKNLKNKRVLVIDDIYDTGHTLESINEKVMSMGAKGVSNLVLIKRTGHHKYDVPIFNYGLEIETDDYLVGCGLDYNGQYRELPYIASVKEEK